MDGGDWSWKAPQAEGQDTVECHVLRGSRGSGREGTAQMHKAEVRPWRGQGSHLDSWLSASSKGPGLEPILTPPVLMDTG